MEDHIVKLHIQWNISLYTVGECDERWDPLIANRWLVGKYDMSFIRPTKKRIRKESVIFGLIVCLQILGYKPVIGMEGKLLNKIKIFKEKGKISLNSATPSKNTASANIKHSRYFH